jgi:hypothetical protein
LRGQFVQDQSVPGGQLADTWRWQAPHVNAPFSPSITRPPAATRTSRSLAASEDLTSTVCSECPSMNSRVVQSAISRPRPITIR